MGDDADGAGAEAAAAPALLNSHGCTGRGRKWEGQAGEVAGEGDCRRRRPYLLEAGPAAQTTYKSLV